MKHKTALVTGDLGFLGRHFASELRKRDYEVYGCDVKRNADHAVPRPVTVDCRDLFKQSKFQYDLAIHCAAIVGGRTQIDGNPLATAESIELDTAYARWLVTTRPKHALYVSSSAVYPIGLQTGHEVQSGSAYDIGVPDDYRLREHDQAYCASHSRIGVPDQVYGWSKLIGEILMDHVRAAGVPVSIVRPFSGYGSDQDLDYPFPSFIRRAATRSDPFEIWGDGTQVRDFIHVDDVVNGALAVIEHDAEVYASIRSLVDSDDDHVVGDIYRRDGRVQPANLCTGVATSFDALQHLVCRLAGYAPSVAHRSAAPTGVSYRVGDPTYMSTIYTPTVSLEQGALRALDHATHELVAKITLDKRW